MNQLKEEAAERDRETWQSEREEMMDLEAELDRLSADLEDSLSKSESLAVKLSS